MNGVVIGYLVLFLSFFFRYLAFPPVETVYTPGQRVMLTGVIWDEPRRNQYSQRFEVNDLTISVPEYPEYYFGNTVTVEGTVEEKIFLDKNGEEVSDVILKNPKVTEEETTWYFKSVVWLQRQTVKATTRFLPADESALLLGITLGMKSGFSKELLDTFTTTGIMHVVAASGSNVATLVGIVLYSLNFFFKRNIAIGATILVIVWYSLLAGFDPPIVRASIMAFIALVAQLIGRQNYSLFTLGVTAWGMLMIEPRLLSDVGFLLSISATAGIILVKPVLDPIIRIPKFVKDDLSTTLAAQVGSLPILLSAFGSFAPLSIVLNLLILWSVPVVMILGLFATVGAAIHPLFAIPFLYGAYPFLVYFLSVVSVLSPSIHAVSVTSFSMFLTISYYLVCISLLLLTKLKK